MKADQFGTPAEQVRHECGWRNAEKGGRRCDGCLHFDAWPQRPDGLYTRSGAACTRIGLATKPSAVCSHYDRRSYPTVPIFQTTPQEPLMKTEPAPLPDPHELPAVGEMIAATDTALALPDPAVNKWLPAEIVGADDELSSRRLIERIGRQKLAAVVSKLLTVTDLLDLREIKESGIYKGFEHIDESGNRQRVTTWEDYCEIVEGRSRESVDLDLKNFDTLGAEFFESARKIGIGPGKMRELRRLPADVQERAQAAAESGNKTALLEIIELQAAERAREREQAAAEVTKLTKRHTDTEEQLSASRERAERLRAKVEEFEDAAHAAALKPPKPDEDAAAKRAKFAEITHQIKTWIMVGCRRGIIDLAEHGEAHGEDHRQFIAGCLIEIERELNILRADFQISDAPDANPIPVWMRDDFDPANPNG
jgi:hypothetical protein